MRSPAKQKVIDYYTHSDTDYKLIWGLRGSMAMHFGHWDETTKNLKEALHREDEVLAEVAKVNATDEVLDMGCGVGGSSIFLAKQKGCRVTGISLTPTQIKTAADNAKKLGAEDRTRFLVMDFEKMDFPEKSFDVVWAIESICHAEDKRKTLKEAFRVLKGGGRLVVADGFLTEKTGIPAERLWLQEFLTGWAVPELLKVDAFKSLLEEVGFRNISYKYANRNVWMSSKILYRFALAGLIFGKPLELLGFRNKAQTGNLLAAYYQHKALKAGLWTYGFFTAEKV